MPSAELEALRVSEAREAQLRQPVTTTAMRERLGSLRRGLGGRSWVTTCNLLSLPAVVADETSLEALRRAQPEVGALEADVLADADRLAALLRLRLEGGGPRSEVVRADLERLESRRERFQVLIGRAREGLAASTGGAAGRFLDEVRACAGRDVRGSLQTLARQLDEWGQSPEAPVLGVGQLSYVNSPAGVSPPLPAGQVTPAYASASTGALAPDDTTQGREVVLSPAVLAKAAELGSPAAIVDFVKHHVRLEWGYGAMKNSDVTLREGSGTQAEVAGLLIALLRAQNVPARYVYGTVEWPVDRVAGAMGVLTPAEADTLAAGSAVVVDAGRRARITEVLTASGIPFQVRGTDLTFAHVWVEAWLPWGSYRGAAIGNEAKQWVALDAALWGTPRAHRAPDRPDAWTAVGGSADALTAAYLSRPRGQSFRSYTKGLVDAWLGSSQTQSSWAQLAAPRAVPREEHLDLLPASLPYKVVAVDGEAAFLPDALLHSVLLEVRAGSTVLLSTTVPSHRLASQRSLVTFKPATPADEAVWIASGSLYAAPPSALNLTPVVRINGVELAAGAGSASAGTPTQLVLEVKAPGGGLRRIENALIAGNVTALGVAAPGNVFTEANFPGDLDGAAEKWLFARAAQYASAWTAAEDEFAGLLDLQLVRPAPSVVLISNQIAVEESLGVRTRLSWRGVQVDADLRTTTPVAHQRARILDFMKLSGFEGSALEASVLTDGTGEDAISTIGVLQEAGQQGVTILAVTPANAPSVLPSLSASPQVLAEVQAALALGRHVRIPQTSLTVENWTGTGFIVRDPTTEEASYFLSGVVSGGVTVVSPRFWTDQALVDKLESHGNPDAITDQTKVARIVKANLPAGSLSGPIDDLSPRLVRAYVTTADGQRVSGVPVDFKALGESSARFPPQGQPCPGTLAASEALPQSMSVISDGTGQVSALVCPDPSLSRRFWLEESPPDSPVMVGITQVQAVARPALGGPIPVPIQLAVPFVLSSRPGQTAAFEDASGDTTTVEGLSMVNSLVVRAVDRFSNPVPNQVVAWRQGSAQGSYVEERVGQPSPAIHREPGSPTQPLTLDIRTETRGWSIVRYVAPYGPGAVVVTATAGTVTQSFPIQVTGSALDQLELRADFAPATSLGTAGTDQQTPFKVRVWKRGSGWAPVVAGPGTRYRGTLTSFGGGQLSQTIRDAEQVEYAHAGDDENNIVIWPRYLAGLDGFQTDVLTVQFDQPTGRFSASMVVSGNRVQPVVVRAIATRLGEATRVLGLPLGIAGPDDVTAGFVVTNPGSTPMYVVFDGSGLHVPVASGVPAALPTASLVPPGSTGFLGRHIVTRGGIITPRVHVDRPSAGPSALEELALVDGAGQIPRLQLLPVVPTITILPPRGVSDPLAGSPSTAGVGGSSAGGIKPASITFPVRSPRSQRAIPTGPAPSTSPATISPQPVDDEQPTLVWGKLSFLVNVDGDVEVYRGLGGSKTLVAQGRVATVSGFPAHVSPIPNVVVPTIRLEGLELQVDLAPGGPAETITVEVSPANGSPRLSEVSTLVTELVDHGVMPLGHTFVKDVNVATGALVKQFTDLSFAGRGNALTFSRTYASNNHQRSPLGMGWNHSWRIYLQKLPGSASAEFKMAVIGGSGGGQTFACGTRGSGQACVPQKGYHGRLEHITGGTSYWEYRTKGGVRYRFAGASDNDDRFALKSVVDPAGYETTLIHRPDLALEVMDVIEQVGSDASKRRRLHFEYMTTTGENPIRLKSVELVDDATSASLGACVFFDYWPSGQLKASTRAKDCAGHGLTRTERFEYYDQVATGVALPTSVKTNLSAYVDPNGNRTTFTWMVPTDSIASDNAFVFFEPESKRERVKAVVEPAPGGGVTAFEYSLSEVPVGLPAPAGALALGAVPTSRLGFTTKVTPARADLQSAGEDAKTIYRFDAYGSGAETSRPLSTGVRAISKQYFGDSHQLEYEVDARGRQTSFRYDGNGNLTERRVVTTALAAQGTAPALAQARDAADLPLEATVEQWAFDDFAQWTRHDEPRAVVNGSPAPATRFEARVTDGATGRVLSHTRGVGAERSTRLFRYHSQTLRAAGSIPGDLVESEDANGNVNTVEAYDARGNATRTRLTSRPGGPPVDITTTAVFNDKSQPLDTSDTVGHHTSTQYDDLDRPWLVSRYNTKSALASHPSPAVVTMETQHFASGHPHIETNLQTGLTRTFALDALNRVVSVVESGGQLPAPLISTTTYDEHGNPVVKVDRRGVATVTAFDFADRPVSTVVCPGNLAVFTAQHGEVGAVAQEPRTALGCAASGGTVSVVTLDAAGNKLAEVDANGHTTTFVLDALYRTVEVVSPLVPGATLTAPSDVSYVTRRRFDEAGRVRREEDGNGKVTSTEYDSLGRVSVIKDALTTPRETRRTYDGNDNVASEALWVASTRQRLTTSTYDALNRVVERQVTAEPGLSYLTRAHYDDVAHTVTTRDARGFLTVQRLDDLDRVMEVIVDSPATGTLTRGAQDPLLTSPLALSTKTAFDANGNARATLDPEGRLTVSIFDGLNRLTSRQQLPMGVTETVSKHDGAGRPVEWTDVRGFKHQAFFDVLGRQRRALLEESLSAGGAWLPVSRTVYDDVPANRLNRRDDFDARGNVTSTYADALGRVVKVEDPAVGGVRHTQHTRYDAKAKREEADRKGFVTRFTWDAVYRPLTQAELSAGAVVQHLQTWVYDDVQRTVTQTDRSGVTTVAQADGLGRVTETRRGPATLQQVVVHTFDPDGRETAVRDANQHTTERLFDGAGRLVRETKGKSATCGPTCVEEVVTKYDGVGNALESKSRRPTGSTFDVRSTFDGLNRAVRIEDGSGSVTSKAYDAAGNLVCVKAPRGSGHGAHGWAAGKTLAEVQAVACAGDKVTTYTWDEVGKQTSVRDANGAEWRFLYDVTRNLVAKLDATGHLTTFANDARNQRTEELQHLAHGQTLPARDALPSFVAPDSAFTTGTLRTRWTYDANGQLEDEVDAKGQTKHHVYGPLKRLASVTYSGHVAPRALPSIDAIAWTYRGEGEVETCSETKTTAAGVVTEVTRHFYDALERRARTRRYDGTETTYGYDVKGNRTLVRDSEGVETGYTWDSLDRLATATTPLGTATYRYFEDGLLKQTDSRNGVTEVRGYDAAGRLTSLETAASGVLVSRFEYAFDANGNRVRQVETRQQSAGEETTYGYDEAGRLIGVAYPSETHLYRLDAVGNRTGEKRLAQVLTPLTVALFAAFTPAQATAAVERQHNAVDWVTAVVDVKASTTTALSYDANGNRTAEGARRYRWDIRDTLTQVEDGTSVVGTYDYDATLQRVKADTAQGHVEYVLDGKYVLREAGARQRRYHFGEGEALAVTGVGGTGAQDRWLHTDALGSVVTEVDATASSVTARQYDAWGNYRNNTAPGVGETRLGYTGHQYDVETGLTYARARYYDSKLGVFLSRDSFEGVLTEAPSLHRYTYAHNQPLKYRDPTGRAGVRTELAREGQKFYEQAQGLEQQAFEQTSEWRAAGLIGLAAAAKTTGIVAEGLQRVWSGFDWVSGGAIGRLDKVHDAQEASASRYGGEFGTLNYLEDVNKEVTLFAAKSVVQLGAGKVVDKVLPAGGSSAGDIAGRGLERAGLRGAISLTPRVVEHVSGGPELTVSEAVRTVGTKVVGDAAGEAAKQLVGEVADALEGSDDVQSAEIARQYEIALGLWKHPETGQPLLTPFAASRNLETYGSYYGTWNPGSREAFKENLEHFLGQASRIHFNLEGFSATRFDEFLKKPELTNLNATNWELYQVLSDPSLRERAVFYGGQPPNL